MNTEKENTWRTLQGLKPIQPLRCRIGWHRWTAFEVREADYSMGYSAGVKCHCADCGLLRYEQPVVLLGRKSQ